jgi:hypothetical protein
MKDGLKPADVLISNEAIEKIDRKLHEPRIPVGAKLRGD